jgi:non-specific serine/threonine protein kinase/serine/threonine-protein kinase
VQQLAGDLEHHRQGLPVSARPDTLAYRAGKRLRRNPVAATFACLTIASVAAGLATSLWQARLAQRRFDDVRQLAHAVVFDVNDALATVPGTTAARSLLVETALAYLDRLARDVGSDPSLREEIAAAYIRVGQVQGGWAQPSLGDSQGAVRSFQKAIAAAGPAPSTVRLARLVIEAHINVAMLAADPGGAAPAFRAAIDAGKALPSGSDDGQTLRLMADAYHGLGLISHLTDQVAEEEEASRREITLRERIAAVSGSDWRDTLGLADAWAQHALAREQMTDYAGSLADLRTAQALLETAHRGDSRNQLIIRGLAEKRSRAGSVLRAMGRLGDSAAELHAAIGLLEPLVAADANNMQYRTDLAYAWFRLGETRRAENRLADALALHRRALEVRRRRAAQDQRLIFIRWDLARSLNAVADLVLATAPERAGEAEALFAEARDAAEQTLAVAPSFNEMRKQLAQACEGLARTTLTRDPGGATAARRLLERSLQTWEHVLSDGPGDLRERDRPARIRALLAGLPAPQHRIDPPAPATLARPASAPAPRS